MNTVDLRAVHVFQPPETFPATMTLVIESAKEWKEFQDLLFRGANLNPDLSASMKAFVDLVCNGQVMQNYRDIQTGKKPTSGE